MKNKVCPTLLAIAALFVCTTSHATLIGDTLTISLQSPLGTTSFSTSTVVASGTSDQKTLGVPNFIVNPEATSIQFINTSTVASVSFPNVGVFNGIVVTGITDTLTSLAIQTNIVGWDDSRVTFDAHSFSLDLRGLILEPNTTDGFFKNEIIAWCNVPIPTPDSSSTASLLAVGVLGLAAVSRRFRQRIT